MKYSTIKNCGEFLKPRIRHLYAPWKESELERERDDKWKAGEEGIDSKCCSEQVPQEHIKWTVLSCVGV